MKVLVRSLIAASLVVLAQAASAEDYPELTFKYSSNIPEVINTSKIDTYFSSELEKRSGGKIKIQHFWANTLGGEQEIVDLVGSGAVDMALIVTGNQYSRMPFAAVTNSLPHTFYDGPKLVKLTRYLFENNPTIQAEFDAANLHPILYRYLPDYRLFCGSKQLKTMEDFKNLKTRSYGAYVPVMFQALGAVPVNIPPNDMIQALKTGALDCTYMFNSSAPLFKVDQVTKYDTDLSFGVINAHTLFMSKTKWEALPDNVKQLINEVAADAETYGNQLIATDEAKAADALKAGGMEIVHFEQPDAFEAAIPDMLEVWVKNMTDAGKGKEAQEMADYIRANR
jgi:TRAP-type transport system periplasmic protein